MLKYIKQLVKPMITPLSLGVIPLAAVAAEAALIDPVSKLIAGLRQKKQAKNLKPSTFMPEALSRATAETRQAAYSSRSLDQGVEEGLLRKEAANQLYQGSQTGTASQKLAYASKVGGNFTDRLKSTLGQGRRDRYGRIKDYENNLLRTANVQADNQAIYEGAKSELTGASMQNIYGGFFGGLGNATGDVLGTIAGFKANQKVGGPVDLNTPIGKKGYNIGGGVKSTPYPNSSIPASPNIPMRGGGSSVGGTVSPSGISIPPPLMRRKPFKIPLG